MQPNPGKLIGAVFQNGGNHEKASKREPTNESPER